MAKEAILQVRMDSELKEQENRLDELSAKYICHHLGLRGH